MIIRELKLIINVGNRSIETLERFEQKFVSLINSRINSGKGCEKFLLKTYDFNSIAFKMESPKLLLNLTELN